MRTFVAAIFLLLAFLATAASFCAIHDLAWEWRYIISLRWFNCLVIAPLWFLAVFLWGPPTKRVVFAAVAVSLVVAGGLSMLQEAVYGANIRSSRPMQCSNQLKQIGLALQQYQKVYGCLPPAYVADAKGKPMHSWRVLLLQFINEDLYREYSFKEPWNGPNNRKLIGTIAKVYHCPADTGNCDDTSYVAVVGSGTAWPGRTSIRTKDIRDGSDKTVSVVEVADSGINWMEPRDISFDKMDFHINGQPRNSISSCHAKGAYVISADCRIQRLSDALSPETVRALLTIASGEAIPVDALQKSH